MSQLSPLQQFEQAVADLVELAAAEGLTLPYAPAFIVAQEQAGHVVDLETGAILVAEAHRGYVATGLGEHVSEDDDL